MEMGKRTTRCVAAAWLAALTLWASVAAGQAPMLQQIERLAARVEVLLSQGQYHEAIPMAQEILAACDRELGTEDPRTAQALDTLVQLFRAIGEPARGEPLARRSLFIREKVFGETHVETARSLHLLGTLHQVAGDYVQAEKLYRRTLAIRDQALGDHPDTAATLTNLASIYVSTGALGRAELLHRRAVAIYEQTRGKHQDTARAHANLANLYRSKGDLEQAEREYRRSIAISEKLLGPEHPELAATLGNLAQVHRASGSYAQAEALLRRALAIREQSFGRGHANTGFALDSLGSLYMELGRYTAAEELFERALAIGAHTRGTEHPETLRSVMNLADLYTQIGAHERSFAMHERLLTAREKLLGQEHPDTVRTLGELASARLALGDAVGASVLLQRVLVSQEQAGEAGEVALARTLFTLATAYLASGDYAPAEPLLQRALLIRERVLGRDHPEVARVLDALAFVYGAGGAHIRAQPLLERVLNIRYKALGIEHPDTGTALQRLAVANWARGRNTSALSLLRQAQAVRSGNLDRFLLSGSQVNRQDYVERLASDTIANVSFAAAAGGTAAVELALGSVLQYKGRLLEAASDNVARLRANLAPREQESFDELAAVSHQFSRLAYRQEATTLDGYRERLEQLSRRQERLATELAVRSSTLERPATANTVAAVARAIPPRAALIEWLRYTPVDPKSNEPAAAAARYVVFVLKRSGSPVMLDMGEAQPIEVMARSLRESLRDPDRKDVHVLATALSQRMMLPLEPHLAGIDHWLIAPDGVLNLVPFAALVNRTGEYLVTQAQVTYLTSGRDLLRSAGKSAARNTVLLADPDYDSLPGAPRRVGRGIEQDGVTAGRGGGLALTRLANTGLEALELRALFKLDEVEVLLRGDASEARLRQLQSPRILHLATHAFFLDEQQLAADISEAPLLRDDLLLRSGIALAGAHTARAMDDDGLLTALEAAHLKLQGTELAVLSASDAGAGELQHGEAVYSWRRALTLAGVQTQVASLWKVTDAATRRLLVDYYQRLLRGEGRSAALRSVQLVMLTQPQLAHPYYWASFSAVGSWGPLSR
jgi:CHAT domain-containing protein/Tfp pilus assembly protein PilF